jgi:aerobic carbon-monoxide dehydrogenase large subunit
MAIERSDQGRGVGASVLRKEDDRHLRGRGQFVADIPLRGTHEVVFLAQPPRACPYTLYFCATRR